MRSTCGSAPTPPRRSTTASPSSATSATASTSASILSSSRPASASASRTRSRTPLPVSGVRIIPLRLDALILAWLELRVLQEDLESRQHLRVQLPEPLLVVRFVKDVGHVELEGGHVAVGALGVH